MKSIALLAAVVMLTTAAPTYAQPDDCDNRAFFENVLTTRPDTPGPPTTSVSIPPEPSMGVDEAVDALVERARDLCMEDLVGRADETGQFPAASTFIALLEIAFDVTTQHCNQGPNIGPGGHYTIMVPPTPPAWGLADSDISRGGTGGTAYASSGFFLDVDTGKAFAYSRHIDYFGFSDFWCMGYFDTNIGDFVTINFPFLEPGIVW